MTLEQANEEQTQEQTQETVPVETPKEEVAQPAFTADQEAKIQEMLKSAVEQAKETGRRELQAQQERNRNERLARERAEAEAAAYKTSLNTLPEEDRERIELNTYRAKDQLTQTAAQQESQRQAQEKYFESVKELQDSMIANAGLTRDDPRINWGDQGDDLVAGLNKFSASITKIVKEDSSKEVSKLREEIKAEIENSVRKVRIDAGLESVNTEQGGGGNTSDAAFVEAMTDGSLPLTEANIERLNKIQGML